MVSKNQIKLITSLQQKKYRATHGLFIAEGFKVIQELLQSNFDLHHLFQTEPLFEAVHNELKSLISPATINVEWLPQQETCQEIESLSLPLMQR